MKKMTSRQKQALKSKLSISDAALKLFKHHPYDEVKVSDICEAANISVGAFYHYFKSKEDVINITYQSLDTLVAEIVNNSEYESNTKAIVDINYQAGLLMEEMGYSFVSAAYQLMMKQDNPITTDNKRPSYLLFCKYINSAIENNELQTEYPVEKLADYFMMMGRAIMLDWCLRRGSYDISEDIAKHTRNAISLINMNHAKIEL